MRKGARVRLVLDTNVVLSGMLWRSHPRRLLDLAKEEAVSLYTSSALLDELAEVLSQKMDGNARYPTNPRDLSDAALRLAGKGGPARPHRSRRPQRSG